MTFPTWRRPSRCGHCECVEVRHADDHVLVRDSKLGDDSPVLEHDRYGWQLMLDAIKYPGTPLEVAGRLAYVELTDRAVYWHGDEGQVLRFDFAEWDAFVAGCRAGEFDLPEVTA